MSASPRDAREAAEAAFEGEVAGLRPFVVAALLSSLATLPAAAWSRPKARAEPPPQPCIALGEGFVRVEAADICIRIGGSVRVEASRSAGAR